MTEPSTAVNLPVRWLRVFFLSIWMACGIGMSSLRWDASVEFLSTEQDYEFKDNTLEKQRAGLNRWLIVGYSSLALLSFIGVATQGLAAFPRFRYWHILPICLLLWCGASLVWSVEPSLTIRRTGHLYMAVLGGLGLVALLNRRELLWTIVLSLSGLCAIGIPAELSHGMFTPWRSGYRYCGIGHPNETALFVVCALLACRVLWLLESKFERSAYFNLRNLIVLIGLFGCVILLLTRSRTTLLSGIVAIFVIQYFYAQSVNAWLFLFGSASLALSLGLFLAIVPTSVSNSVFSVAAAGRTTHVASLTGRLPLWEEIIRQWQREPMLGYGYGGYWSTRRVEDFAQMFYWEPPNGHSIYIDSLVETGPVGLVLLALTLAAMMFVGMLRFPRTQEISQLFVIGLSALIAIHGLAESSFFKGCFGPLMFSLGIAMLAARSSSSLSRVRHSAAAAISSKSNTAQAKPI